MIPTIIHQIWFQGYQNVPKHLKDYSDSWRKNNSEYTFMFWDQITIEKLIDDIAVDWITETYNHFDIMIQKIDFAKYIILYYIGGIYIDIDVKSIKPLSFLGELLNSDLLVSEMPYDFWQRALFFVTGYTDTKVIVNNGIIMTRKNHPVLLDTMHNVEKYRDNLFKNRNKFLYIFNSTGPLVLTEALKNYIQKENIPKESKEIIIVDQTYFEGCDIGDIKYTGCEIPENAIGLHYYESAWVSDSEKKLLGVYYKIKDNIYFVVLLIVLVYFYIKLHRNNPPKYIDI